MFTPDIDRGHCIPWQIVQSPFVTKVTDVSEMDGELSIMPWTGERIAAEINRRRNSGLCGKKKRIRPLLLIYTSKDSKLTTP